MGTGPIKQFHALTGLRAFAAIWVVVYHLKEVAGGHYHNFGLLDPIVRRGAFGVDVFFVLSGFIMTHVYSETFSRRVTLKSYGSFLQNRIARIYPLHIVTLGIMLVLYLASRDLYSFVPRRADAYSPASIVANLTMTHAWFPGVWAPNTPAWSISAEWFAYLVFPLAFVLLSRAGMWLQAAIIPVALAGIAFSGAQMPPLVQISTEFSIGMGACLLYKRFALGEGRARGVARYAGIIAVGLIVASLYAYAEPPFWIAALCAAVLIVSLATEADLLVPVLSAPLIVYLGEISYSIYMCQWFVWSTWRRGFPRLIHHHIPDFVLMGSACVAILAVSVLAYHYVEIPGRRWIRRMASREASDRVAVSRERAGAPAP